MNFIGLVSDDLGEFLFLAVGGYQCASHVVVTDQSASLPLLVCLAVSSLLQHALRRLVMPQGVPGEADMALPKPCRSLASSKACSRLGAPGSTE
jgi:hypothetical protein